MSNLLEPYNSEIQVKKEKLQKHCGFSTKEAQNCRFSRIGEWIEQNNHPPSVCGNHWWPEYVKNSGIWQSPTYWNCTIAENRSKRKRCWNSVPFLPKRMKIAPSYGMKGGWRKITIPIPIPHEIFNNALKVWKTSLNDNNSAESPSFFRMRLSSMP